MFVPLLILACGTSAPSAEDATETLTRLREAAPSNALALPALEADYTLPKPNWDALGVDPAAIGSWNVQPAKLPKQPKHNSPAYALPLPFELIGDEKGFRPMGLDVAVGEDTIPFARTPTGR